MPCLLLAVVLQAGAGPPPDPADLPGMALRAVEADTAAAAEASWRRAARAADRSRPLVGLGFLALYRYRYAEADSLFREAAAGHRTVTPAAAWARLGLALVAANQGRVAAADSLFARATAAATAAGDRRARRDGLLSWAGVRLRRGGEPTPAELIARADSAGDPTDPAWRYRLRCVAGQITGHLRGARVSIRSQYDTADSAAAVGRRRLAGRCLFTAAARLATSGYGDSATAWYRRAADWQRDARDRSSLAVTLQWLGFLLVDRGDYAEGGTVLRESVREGTASGNFSPVAFAHVSLARIAASLRDRITARMHAALAESLFVEQGDRFGRSAILQIQATLAAAGPDPADAVPFAEQWHREASALGFGWPAGSHRLLGTLALREGRLDVAEARLDSAASVAERWGLRGLALTLQADRARLALARGDAAAAIAGFERLHRTTAPDQVAFRSAEQIDLAEAYTRIGRPAVAESLARHAVHALDVWRAGLSQRELRRVVFDLSQGVDPTPGLARVIAALAAAGRTEAAFELAERRRARQLLDRLVLAGALADSGGGPAGPTGPGPGAEPAGPADLGPGEALLEYVVGEPDDPATLFIVTREGVAAAAVPSGRSLGTATGRFLSLLESGAPGDELAHQLGRSLIEPALPRLDATQRLIIVPDGPLHALPFDALLLSDGRRLLARFVVSTAPSLAVWTRLRAPRERADPARLLALGHPRFADPESGTGPGPLLDAFGQRGGLTSLPASVGEVRDVGRFFEAATIRTGSRATEAFLRRTDLQPYSVIHLATHALVDDQTVARTALALAPGQGEDGFVTPADLAALSLRADLVVLSACRTARGVVTGGEGVQGLAMPLLGAGARAVLATEWAVGDRAARSFVQAFYREVAAGRTLSEGLGATKLAAIARGESPAVWAAFKLVGNGDTRLALAERPAPPGGKLAVGIGLVLSVLLVAYGLVMARRRAGDRSRAPSGQAAATHQR